MIAVVVVLIVITAATIFLAIMNDEEQADIEETAMIRYQ